VGTFGVGRDRVCNVGSHHLRDVCSVWAHIALGRGARPQGGALTVVDLVQMGKEIDRLYREAHEALVRANQVDEVYRKLVLEQCGIVAQPESC